MQMYAKNMHGGPQRVHERDLFFMVGKPNSKDAWNTYLSADLSHSFTYTPRPGTDMMDNQVKLEDVSNSSEYDSYCIKVTHQAAWMMTSSCRHSSVCCPIVV